jgi:Kef-type K+ transport system membrane component KefB
MMSYANDKRRFAVLSFVLCLLYAYAAERVFGVGSITGAFIAGLIIAKTARVTYVISRLEIVSYMFVAPVFFASIGIKVVIPQMTEALMLFMLLLLLTAVLGKIVGCGIGAKLCGYSRIDSLRVGLGMVARGEVALVVANQGIAGGLMKAELLGAIVIVVVVTPIISPILLRMSYKTKKADYSDLVYSELVDQYQEAKDFDLASQTILNMHDELRGQGKTDQGEPHGEEGTKAG